MTTPYPTGCNSHCNNGADCTETTQHCRVVDKAGNALPTGDMKEINFSAVLFGCIAVAAGAAAIVLIMLPTYAKLYNTFFN